MQPTIDPSADGLEWAQRLVRINTVSHHSNLELIECVADHLRALKVPLRLTWDAERRKANLFATLGEGKPNGIILSGHTDTVPWDGQAWSTDPLDPVIRDGRLYGRGSADMKGFIGLSVAHASHFLEADLPFAVHYAFSYDEEIGCVGVQGLIADLRDENLEPRLCVVGEPTRMIPAIAHKGIQRWRCCVRGKAAHSAQTPFAVNAIEAGARLVAHIADMADRWRAEGPFNRDYDVPHSTAAVAVIAGGIADNVVPEDCRIHYEFRNLPGTDDVAMQRQVFERAAELEPAMKSIEPTAGFSFENFASCPSFLTTPDRAAVRLAQYLAETEATTVVAFGTEAGLFQRAGIDTVVCGPGDISQAHQADEFVSLEQLARCEHFLLRLKNSETFL